LNALAGLANPAILWRNGLDLSIQAEQVCVHYVVDYYKKKPKSVPFLNPLLSVLCDISLTTTLLTINE